ncbi:MAG: 2OG-Fe(II) oxygenase [Alphaproteobacteria bacterium]|jgi:predicted 2-oxoglutarate/Fe(II)-dependent dioxygenase YbiX|nr:2OG-Fe(II) oxygenase [Alphaproteobacteria bacterium]
MLASYQDLNSQLMTEGTVVVSQEDLPISSGDWETLSSLLDNQTYERVVQGDTDERTSVSVYRIKKAGDSHIRNQQIVDIINTPKIKSKLAGIMGVEDYKIDRCQCNLYYEGDFVGKHVDKESCSNHTYAFMVFPCDEFEGGEFCVYNPENSQPYVYKPEPQTLILTRCDLLHEVREITKGKRRAIVSFLQLPH